ncbi:hypothetical protein AMECASPLE_015992 [Ameca splendens]|uniref:Uncharacterized protein n=1 Tax=Ameca splendens TaxID=208324 RepID=A0ABV0ZMV9_9TELE
MKEERERGGDYTKKEIEEGRTIEGKEHLKFHIFQDFFRLCRKPAILRCIGRCKPTLLSLKHFYTNISENNLTRQNIFTSPETNVHLTDRKGNVPTLRLTRK